MTEKILSNLKIFFEKHLIPTIIAIVLSFITYYFTPLDSSFMAKLTLKGYCIFVFFSWFLAIKLFIWLEKRLRCFFDTIENAKICKKNIDKEERNNMENLWTKVDSLSNDDFKLLEEFMSTNNKPKCIEQVINHRSLLNSDWVYKSHIGYEKREQIWNKESLDDNIALGEIEYSPMPIYQYKLKDNIYKTLKYSLDKYNKISHFER